MVLSYSKAAQYTQTAEPVGGSSEVVESTPKVFTSKAPSAPSGDVDAASAATEAQPEASSSSSTTAQPAANSQPSTATSATAGPSSAQGKPQITHLILDAGPLLSLTPLRHLAQKLYTTPAVLAELRDPKAREYLKRIQDGVEGVELVVGNPSGESMARVIAFAKKTGDYAVLSTTDLGVIALTLQYEIKENGTEGLRLEPGQVGKRPVSATTAGGAQVIGGAGSMSGGSEKKGEEQGEAVGRFGLEDGAGEDGNEVSEGEQGEAGAEGDAEGDEEVSSEDEAEVPESASEPPADQLHSLSLSETSPSKAQSSPSPSDSTDTAPTLSDFLLPVPTTGAADSDSDSDAGEWITPSTLSTHRSRDLGHLPEGGRASQKDISAACMTGDFAVQNVLLAMGLGVVGEGGKRIGKVKSWVLRCHACFKICKDPSKKFCPSCGNPTLLRTSTTTTSNGKTHLHLKKNYQYNLRGSKFTIPDAKPGRAKGQVKGGTGLILREDQREWVDAVRHEEGRKGKEERRMLKGWDDPDWMPEIITVGMSGKGRMGTHGLPNIGHGRKNPNIAKKKR